MGKSNFIRHTFHPMLRKAGLPVRKFHTLRHTHASILLSRGRSIKAVSERLGHSSPELTLRIYAHLMPGDGKETARVLDQAFGSFRTGNGTEKGSEGTENQAEAL
jgi:integrase